MADHGDASGGGFIHPSRSNGLLSPAPSSSSTSPASNLPHPRHQSLQPGSNKEDTVRRYVEDRLFNVSRRYVKKFGDASVDDDVVGYQSFGEVCRDLDGVVNVLWLSGTPSLQIPFLLRLASDVTQYVRPFPPSPRATFQLLGKLDHCFSSLLRGQDVDSSETLPGFRNGLRDGMTVTDMVRCRSLVEQTRVLIIEVLSSDVAPYEDEEDEDETGDDATETEASVDGTLPSTRGTVIDVDEDRLHLDAARIYENTIVALNERLGDPLNTTVTASG